MIRLLKVIRYSKQLRSGKLSWRVRKVAAEELGKRSGPFTVRSLLRALSRDSDILVRAAAAEALIGLRVVTPLVNMLGDSNIDKISRNFAAEALGKLGDQRAVDPLIKALQDSERWVHRSAAEALGKLGDTRAVEPLIEALRDSEKQVSQAAAKALGMLGDRRAVGPLIKILGDLNDNSRETAI